MPAANAIQEEVIQQQILQAARILFEKHGYQKVTMDDVAKAIGKGRSSLYYYYKSKDEIFDAVMDAEIGEFIAELSQTAAHAATTEEKIYAFCIAKTKAARKRKAFFNALASGMDADEISQYAQKKHALHARLMKEEGALIRQIILHGIKSNELPGLEKATIETAVYVLLCSLHGLKREMVLENDYSRMEAAMFMLAHMTVQGIKK